MRTQCFHVKIWSIHTLYILHIQFFRTKLRSMSYRVCASIHPVTLDMWLTATLNLLWSAVNQKNGHLVSRNPHIRAAPLLIWKIHTKTQQQKDKEIVKVLQQNCSKLPPSDDFSFSPSAGFLFASPLPSLPPFSPDRTSSSFLTSLISLCSCEGHHIQNI